MKDSVKIVLIVAIMIVLIVAMSLFYSFQREKSLNGNENFNQQISELKAQIEQLSNSNDTIIDAQSIIDESKNNIEKNSVIQTLQVVSSKFGIQNPEIKNNITFEYRFKDSKPVSIVGKSVKLKNVLTNDSQDLVRQIFSAINFKININNDADGVGASISGYDNAEIACLVEKINSQDLEIKCGEIK